MGKARSLAEFRAALARNAIPYMNVTYADVEGNVYYVYNGVWYEPVTSGDDISYVVTTV